MTLLITTLLVGPGGPPLSPANATVARAADASLPLRCPTPLTSGGPPCLSPAQIPSVSSVAGASSSPGSNPALTLAWAAGPPPSTAAGSGAGMAADPAGDQAVLFGGEQNGVLSNATQVYNESTDTWKSLGAGAAPSPRASFAIGADTSARVAVVFGGVVNATTGRVDNQTWIYHFATATWTNVTSSVAPAARENAALAVNTTGGYALLFGGTNPEYTPTSSLTYRDLWEFNFTTDLWSPLAPAGPRPPALQGAMLTRDTATGEFLLYGGCYPCSSNVWEFRPATGWSEAPTANGTVPSPRASGAWSWDPVDQVAVLFGGTNGSGLFNSTFEYLPVTNSWVEQTPTRSPSIRSDAAAAWLDVPGNETLLLSGGAGAAPIGPDLWRLAPTASLSVLVENASSGLPITGARVLLGGSSVGSTDPAGYLNLTQVNPTETILNISHLGYADAQRAFWLAPASSTSEAFQLVPVPPARVSVQVVENGTQVPIPGASVSLTVDGFPMPAGTPGGSGFVNFTDVPSARPAPNATVTASAPLNYSGATTFFLEPNSTVQIQLGLVPYPVLKLGVIGVLAVATVVPVRNANITENGVSLGRTDGAGWLNRTSLVPGGNVTLAVTAEGFSSLTAAFSLPSTGVFTTTFHLTGLPYGTLFVTVHDAATGEGLLGADVNISSTGLGTVVFNSIAPTRYVGQVPGVVSEQVPTGSYWVNATLFGYHPAFALAPVFVGSGRLVSISVNMTLLPGANVSVLVRADHGGPPIPGARVSAQGLLVQATTTEGWANFTNVHFGPTIFEVSCPGYANNSTLLTLNPMENVSTLVNLTSLSPGGRGSPGNGSLLFGNDLPTGVEIWPYALVVVFTVVGALVYLLFLRVAPRADESREENLDDWRDS